jgi:predicted cupin superfamily sugar epimerase
VSRHPPTAHARAIIEALRLAPLPGEGGFFRQTWRSETSSAILFLLTATDFSALHRLEREEVWHFHGGEPVEHVQLDPATGRVRITTIGADVLAGEEPQMVVPAGIWQGARLKLRTTAAADFALLGCTVSPPWEDRCFTLADRAALTQAFPAHVDLIRALTR